MSSQEPSTDLPLSFVLAVIGGDDEYLEAGLYEETESDVDLDALG